MECILQLGTVVLTLWYRATSYSYVEWQNWGYHNSETPEPIGVGNYVSDLTPQAKNSKRSPSEIVPASGWNVTIAWFLVFSFFVTHIFARVQRLNTKLQKRF